MSVLCQKRKSLSSFDHNVAAGQQGRRRNREPLAALGGKQNVR
jgi:hypothetical protein